MKKRVKRFNSRNKKLNIDLKLFIILMLVVLIIGVIMIIYLVI